MTVAFKSPIETIDEAVTHVENLSKRGLSEGTFTKSQHKHHLEAIDLIKTQMKSAYYSFYPFCKEDELIKNHNSIIKTILKEFNEIIKRRDALAVFTEKPQYIDQAYILNRFKSILEQEVK